MKLRGLPATGGIFRHSAATAGGMGASAVFFCGILLFTSCRPSPESAPRGTSDLSGAPDGGSPSSVVSIPEEFRSTAPVPSPEPPRVVLPRVVFAVSDFQVTLNNGIQGIRAGEALNFVRQEGHNYVVEYGGVAFTKNKSFFAETYVEPPRAEPSAPPATEDVIPVAKAVLAEHQEPALPGEPPLSGPVPEPAADTIPDQKEVGDLTDSIRKLNDQIRTAQEELERKSTQAAAGGSPTSKELKKAGREIQKLKEARDELSGKLTEMGKP